MQGPYGNNVNGKAEIYEKNGVFTLVFDEKFTISNGPDLYVYVSKESQPSQFISLGKLKSVNGGQTYTFSSSVNFEEYKYAVVHCQQQGTVRRALLGGVGDAQLQARQLLGLAVVQPHHPDSHQPQPERRRQ